MRCAFISIVVHLSLALGGRALQSQVFSATAVTAPIISAATPTVIRGDFDGSGIDDVLVWFRNPTPLAPQTIVGAYFDPGTNPMMILGAATPTPVVTTFMFPTLWQLHFVEKANLNADDLPDLFVEIRTNTGATELWALMNNGNGTFAAPTLVDTLIGPSAKVAVGNFDGDGVDEYMSRNLGSLRISDPNGVSTLVETATFVNQFSQIIVGDWNGDGAKDALFAFDTTVTAPGLWLRLFSGSTSGTFAPTSPSGISVSTNISSYAMNFAVNDVNQDGADDFLATPTFPGTATPMLQLGGFGGFGASFFFSGTGGTQLAWMAPELADIDEDGLPDIISTSSSAGAPVGSVTMSVGHIYPTNSAPNGATTMFNSPPPNYGPYTSNPSFPRAIGDFDGDGDNDVVVMQQATVQSFFYYIENRSTFGVGCVGSLGIPRLELGMPSVSNTTYTISVVDARPNSIGFILPSLAAATAPGCILVDIGAPNFIPINGGLFSFPTSAAGTYSVAVNLSPYTALIGQTLFFQAAIVDPAGSFAAIGMNFSMTAGRSVKYY